MRKLLITLALLLTLSLPVYAQDSEGGDSVSPAPSITIGIEDALVGMLISGVTIGLYVFIRRGKEFRKANPTLTQIVFKIGDVVVTVIPGTEDNDWWNWLKAKIEAEKEITFDELRDELNEASR